MSNARTVIQNENHKHEMYDEAYDVFNDARTVRMGCNFDLRCDHRINCEVDKLVSIISSLILFLMATAPCRQLYKDADARNDLAEQFVSAGERYGLDPALLVVWSFGESSLRGDAKGALGEIGLFQVHGKHRQACEGAGIEPRGVECGAFLIDMDRRFCGGLERGLMRYASGKCSGTPRAKRIMKRRLRQVLSLKRKASE